MTRGEATPLAIPPHLQERQTTASDPQRSIWVSANAGSGKTHVLTQRVIRLLLDGVIPSKILCLTFTKAAAAQMATRVFATLSKWTLMDDGELRAAILATGAPPPNDEVLLLARRLFTRTVETPGGLKIQTIHAFCERLLHLFPFEANVPARFEVADDRRTEEMLSLAKRAAIADTKDSPALAIVADLAGASGIHPLIAQAMKPRAKARRIDPTAQSGLAARLGVGGFGSVADVRRRMVEEGISPLRWPLVADVMDTGLATDGKYAIRLREASGALDRAETALVGHAEALRILMPVFFDSEDRPRKNILTKRLATAHPDLVADLAAERDRLDALRQTLKAVETVERTQGLIALVDAVLQRYDDAKIAQGLLDFNDLIDRTRTLLERSDAGWVLHKLDSGIDHVLVDEAQDTSEAQWNILERLTGDFASGETAQGRDRSFFVVGDDKQSIFSFQGAAPLKFDQMRENFERRFKAGGKPFERVALKTSFRSVPGILQAVDTVFESALHQDGLVQSGEWPLHESIKSRLPGLVEIWPRVKAEPVEDPRDWSIPLDVPAERDPVNIIADRVAKKIKALLAADSNERVHDGRSEIQRRIRAGDIIVLVRTRGAFFEAVIRALKQHYIEVAGADRLDVANHIAVMDLVAAGRTALLPADDLSLACLLKSPLFGFDDDDLIALTENRRGTLFDALGAATKSSYRDAHATISQWSARAVAMTPFAFYVELLGRGGGRLKMETRLGPEAHDAIDEFLRLALDHERQGAPSLGCFLTDVEALESSIKRDMEGPGEMVRVMTVHAAKGLEAKIVFLPDTCAVPAQQLDPTVFDLDKDTDKPPLLVWSPRKKEDAAIVAAAREQERKATMREYRRLLYVALTRAEERLYIGGFFNVREPPEDCWGAMIERAFPDAAEIEAPWDGGDVVRRIVSSGATTDASMPVQSATQQTSLALPPSWLARSAPTPRVADTLRPSRLRRERQDAAEARGLVYGSALHLLLQYLPGLPKPDRDAAARAFLDARKATIPADMHDDLRAEAAAVMALPALAPLFGPAARAEVAIIGRLQLEDGTIRDVRGAVDRLATTDTDVVVADFKTGAPQDPVPRDYLAQMALYRRVLAPLWPDRPLRMLLVWTRDRIVAELPPDALERALSVLPPSA